MKNVINKGPKVMGFVLFIVLLLMIAATPGAMQGESGDYELTWYSFGGAIGKTSGGGFELNGGSGCFPGQGFGTRLAWEIDLNNY